MMRTVPASLKPLSLVTVSSWGSILAKPGGRAAFVECLLCVRHVHIYFTQFSEPPCVMDTHIPLLQREKLGPRVAQPLAQGHTGEPGLWTFRRTIATSPEL